MRDDQELIAVRSAQVAVALLAAVAMASIAADAPPRRSSLTVGAQQRRRQLNPGGRRPRARLRGLEPPVRHAHRQGGRRLRDDPRPGRVVGGVRRRPDLHLHAARGAEVVRRRAAHRRRRRVHDQPLARRGVVNHFSTTVNLDATALDDRTVQITSSVPDPKLPTMDVYIVPKHIYEKLDADAILEYDALDGVGSGPYTLKEWRSGQYWTMVKNPNWYGPRQRHRPDRLPGLHQRRRDGRRAASRARSTSPTTSRRRRSTCSRVRTASSPVDGQQGGFTELALNGGAGRHRRRPPGAAGHQRPPCDRSRDRPRRAVRPRRARPRRARARRCRRRPTRAGCPISATSSTPTTPPRPTRSSTTPATSTPTATASARCPTAAARSSSATPSAPSRSIAAPIARVRHRMAARHRHRHDGHRSIDDSQLDEVVAKGNYDLFVWGWTPFVDPDPMLSYFTCAQVTTDPDSPGYNDANWCSAGVRRALRAAEGRARPDQRRDIVHEMLQAVQPRVDLPRAAAGRRHPGLPHRPLRGLAEAAGRHRPGAVHQHVADLRQLSRSTPVRAGAVTAHRVVGVVVAAGLALHRGFPRHAGAQELGERDTSGRDLTLGHRKMALARHARVRLVFNFFLFRLVETDPLADVPRPQSHADAAG